MKRNFCIYLAGNIKKGKEDEHDLVWSQKDMDELQENLHDIEVVFLNPASRSDDLSDQKSVFGRDLFQVYSSHAVFVDVRAKRGLGVGAEMMFAKMNNIPVIGWLPEDSHYHRKHIYFLGQHVNSWIHPFVMNLCDYLAPDMKHAAQWVKDYLLPGKVNIKGPESVKEAMNHYLTTQLHQDDGMNQIVQESDYFNSKMLSLLKTGQS